MYSASKEMILFDPLTSQETVEGSNPLEQPIYAALVGAAVGVGALAGLLILVCSVMCCVRCCVRQRRRKRKQIESILELPSDTVIAQRELGSGRYQGNLLCEAGK